MLKGSLSEKAERDWDLWLLVVLREEEGVQKLGREEEVVVVVVSVGDGGTKTPLSLISGRSDVREVFSCIGGDASAMEVITA